MKKVAFCWFLGDVKLQHLDKITNFLKKYIAENSSFLLDIPCL